MLLYQVLTGSKVWEILITSVYRSLKVHLRSDYLDNIDSRHVVNDCTQTLSGESNSPIDTCRNQSKRDKVVWRSIEGVRLKLRELWGNVWLSNVLSAHGARPTGSTRGSIDPTVVLGLFSPDEHGELVFGADDRGQGQSCVRDPTHGFELQALLLHPLVDEPRDLHRKTKKEGRVIGCSNTGTHREIIIIKNNLYNRKWPQNAHLRKINSADTVFFCRSCDKRAVFWQSNARGFKKKHAAEVTSEKGTAITNKSTTVNQSELWHQGPPRR